MKNIKNLIIALMLTVAGGFSACGDDFLKQDPQTSLSIDQVFESLDNVQFYLDGLYYKWRDTRVNRKGFFLMLGTDESQQGEYQLRTDADQSGLDKYDGFMNSENKAVGQLWNIRWPIVVQAWQGINKMNGMKATNSKDSVRLELFLGQAHFYKAAVMFELAAYWGALPVPQVEGVNVTLSGRRTLQETYRIIEEDLLKASQKLPAKPDAGNVRIPTRWAALALLGKLYMFAPQESGYRDFNKAKDAFQEIVNKGGFSLTPKFADLWDGNKTPAGSQTYTSEQVYTFFFNNVWPDTNEAQWYTGSRAASGNPTNYIGGYDMILPTIYSRTDAGLAGGLWEEGDLRRNESIRYDFYNGSNAPNPVAGFGEDQLFPHIKKYEDKRTDGVESFYRSGKNMYYIRYADVLLSLAECMNETGETAAGVKLINDKIRTRAWGGSLPADKKWDEGMSQTQFRTMIMDERMRELCFEGWRRFDLIRTGTFVNNIKSKNRWAAESGKINENHKLYPIPLTEIKMNTSIDPTTQNPGY